MLQRIRDRSQGWIAAVIIGVISLTFALWGIHNYFEGSGQSATVAKVNGYEITQQEFDTTYQRAYQQEQQQMGAAFPDTPAFSVYLKQQVLRKLITDRVLSDAAQQEGFRVSQAQIDALLRSIPIFQMNGAFSQQRYEQALSALMFTPQSFNQTVEQGMLIQQAHSAYTDTAFALPGEVDNAISLIDQHRDIQYLIIPPTAFTKNLQISDAMIQSYYQANPSLFQTPEQVSVEYLQLSAKSIIASLHPTDAVLQQYYQSNISNFTTPERKQVAHILIRVPANATSDQLSAARQKAEFILKQLQQGVAFSQLAAQNSDDILSAKKGGMIGWISPGELGSQYDNALQSITQVNQLSSVIQTPNGFEILKVLAIQPAKTQPFAQVKEKIQQTVIQQQAETQFANESDQLSSLTYENPGSLKPAADALNLPIQTTPLFGRSGGITGLTANQKVIQAAFSDSVLAQGNNSDVIQLDSETVIVIRVNQHQPASLMPLQEVKPQIEKALVAKAAAVKADQEGQLMLDGLHAGKLNPQDLARKYGVQWQTLKAVSRHQEGVNALILDTAFSIAKPVAGQAISWGGATMPDGGALVVGVTQVIAGDPNNLPKGVTRDQFLAEAEKAAGDLDYNIYLLDRLSHATIKPEKSALPQSRS